MLVTGPFIGDFERVENRGKPALERMKNQVMKKKVSGGVKNRVLNKVSILKR